jgi:hypothetical protein
VVGIGVAGIGVGEGTTGGNEALQAANTNTTKIKMMEIENEIESRFINLNTLLSKL